MAETAPTASQSNPAKPRVASPNRAARPDFATLGGICVALFGIIGGLILEKGSLQDITQLTAALIVLGGTFGAVLVTTPLGVMIGALGALRHVFFEQSNQVDQAIDMILQFAGKARRNGIVSLETEAQHISDPFLQKALALAVDGTDLHELRKMMELEMEIDEKRREAEARVWDAAGGYAPTIGIIGAVMGLIQVMKHLEDIKEVGHGIAVAFVATVYGVGSANIFFLPAGDKLKARIREVLLLKELMLEGVIGIVEGLNPTLMRLKLEAYTRQKAKAATRAKAVMAPQAGKPPLPAAIRQQPTPGD
jgi:chemotaxis protein MotA